MVGERSALSRFSNARTPGPTAGTAHYGGNPMGRAPGLRLLGITLRRHRFLLQLLGRSHPVIRHLQHHVLVFLLLGMGCPAQALRGKIAVLLRRSECRTHDLTPYTITPRVKSMKREPCVSRSRPKIGD